jgi:murein tripeptide amidase MpaA
MVNVDGVMYGNSRCDISGSDINRQLNTPNKILHPIVFACKEMFTRLAAEGYEIDYFLDFHGHSKKYFCTDSD